MLGIVCRTAAIQFVRDVVAFGPDHVFVPSGLVELRQRCGRSLHQDAIATGLVVETAPVLLPDVGLIARDFMRVRNRFAPELNPAVASGVDKPELENENEIAVFCGCAQEIVVSEALVFADDHAVLHAPDTGSVDLPSIEVPAVEERYKVRVGGL